MRRATRVIVAGAGGVIAGLIASTGVLATTGVGTPPPAVPVDRDPAGLIEATHLPPLLTLPGEPVTLRYDLYCAPPGADPESGAPCDGAGTVYLRAGATGPFSPVPLRLDGSASQGRYVADVPADIAGAGAGFSYYAVLRSRTSGATTTLPAGGSQTPMRSLPLENPVLVTLGTHTFAAVRRPAERVAAATWGSGAGQVGLEPGPQLQPVGGASFDVGATGVVSLLDEANRRVLRFTPGRTAPAPLAVGVRGTIADLAAGANGDMTVLETVADDNATPLVRHFDASGGLLSATHIAERSASSVQMSADGPVVLAYPSGEWLPVAERGTALAASAQRRLARVGRPLGGGLELVVEREGSEARIAEVGPRGVRRSWRIQSSTELGEVQLARSVGDKVVAVLRVYTDSRDEFEVLVLGDQGVVDRFSVDSAAWAETAPLGRFRLHGSSLYELGSTPAGVFVDRYELETS